jgi:hypothetical protein
LWVLAQPGQFILSLADEQKGAQAGDQSRTDECQGRAAGDGPVKDAKNEGDKGSDGKDQRGHQKGAPDLLVVAEGDHNEPDPSGETDRTGDSQQGDGEGHVGLNVGPSQADPAADGKDA